MARRFDSSRIETVLKGIAMAQLSSPAPGVVEIELNSIALAHSLRIACNLSDAEIAQGTGLALDTVRHDLSDKFRHYSMRRIINYLVEYSNRMPTLAPYISGVPLYRIENKPGTENDPCVYQLRIIVPFSSLAHALAKKHCLQDKALSIVPDVPSSPLRCLRHNPMYSQGMYFEGLEKVLVEIDRADPHPVVRKYPSDYFYTITRIAPPVCEADKEPISTQFLPPEQAKQWRDSVCPERGLSERGRGSLIESGQIPSMRYLSPKQAKQWLDDICPGHGLSESGLNFLIESGQIPSIAVSPKKRLINVMQIERYLAGKPGNPFS